MPTCYCRAIPNDLAAYAWTVQAADAAGNRSALSIAKTFKVCSGLAPSMGQRVAGTNLPLRMLVANGLLKMKDRFGSERPAAQRTIEMKDRRE